MNLIGKSNRKYFTRDQKLQILTELETGKFTCSDLARKYGIHPMTLYKWKRAMGNTKRNDEIDVEDILRENRNISEENEMLKKALANMALKNEILQTANDILKKTQVRVKPKWQKK